MIRFLIKSNKLISINKYIINIKDENENILSKKNHVPY